MLLLLQACDSRATVEAPAGGLRPLADYDGEHVRGVQVLWNPAFRAEEARRRTVRAALDADLASLDAATAAAVAGTRVAVSPSTGPVPALPSGGRGVGWHRSAQWLVGHGFDAEREGVVEIYDASDYLADRRSFLLALAGARGVSLPTPAPPLREYTAETVEGLTVLWAPSMEDDELRRRVRAALTWDLVLTRRAVSEEAWTALAGTRIAVNAATREIDGTRVRGIATHVSEVALVIQGYEADREGVVEVMDARDYLQWRAEQPMVVLHELTHVLEHRADREVWDELRAAYTAARADGRYEAVEYVMGEGPRRAYALGNVDEYGAELAEALYGRNDYAPFDREALRRFDPAGCAAVARLWRGEC